jgi:hypothetical protein
MAATERDITEDLIRDLLREQYPDLADRPSKFGDDLAVRLPWATQSPLPRGRPQAEIAGARWPTTPHRNASPHRSTSELLGTLRVRPQQRQEAPVTPSAKVFFDEVRTVYAPIAAALGLTGPEETERVIPCASYKSAVVEYRIRLDDFEGTVECSVKTQMKTVMLTVDIEPLAITAGVVEKRGRISFSARNLKQLRNSLHGQADYVQRVHPFLADADAAQELMRQAGAREWH